MPLLESNHEPDSHAMTEGNADEEWVVYLLQCADGTLYCGVTNDLCRRIDQHHRGRGARYTRGRTPLILLGHAPFPGRGEAQRVEYRIKQQPADRKLAYLASLGGDGFVAGALHPRQRKEPNGIRS